MRRADGSARAAGDAWLAGGGAAHLQPAREALAKLLVLALRVAVRFGLIRLRRVVSSDILVWGGDREGTRQMSASRARRRRWSGTRARKGVA